jgi:hypothetical protein
LPRQPHELGDGSSSKSGIQAEVRTVIAATEHDRELISDPSIGANSTTSLKSRIFRSLKTCIRCVQVTRLTILSINVVRLPS